jgi:tetratricopeptide (TPR) repeat protein
MTAASPNAAGPVPPSAGGSRRSRGGNWLICLSLVLATLAAYWPVRHFEFLNYDDTDGIVRTPMIRGGLNGTSVAWAFANRHMGNWQPVTSLSHMLDCQLFGLNPGPPHVVNVLFHLANTILLFLLLNQLTGARWRSAFVAALFALHPVHVESVAWVSERKDVLSTFFFLLTLMAYASYAQRHISRFTLHAPRSPLPAPRYYVLSLLLFSLGLMSKPMLVTVPFVLLLLDYWPLRRLTFRPTPQPPASPARLVIFEKLPFLAMAGLMSWITLIAQERSGAVAELSVVPLPSRIANVFVSCARYIQKMVWPEGFVAYYPRVLHWPVWQVAIALLIVGGVTWLSLREARRRPCLLVGWLWFVGTLVPVIGLVQVGTQSMADRYTYIPLIGLFIMAAWGTADLWAERRLSRRGLGLLAGAALAVCLVLARAQVGYWQSSLTLFRHALAVRPDVPLVYNNIGSALYDEGKYAEAIPYLRKALSLKRAYVDALNNLGLSLWHLGREQEALEQFAAVLQQGPDAKAYYNMGVVLFNQNKLDDARQCFQAALQLQPNNAEAHNNLGNVLASQGKANEAGEQFAAAVAAAPDLVEAQCNLARYFAGKGDAVRAAECYRAALSARPDLAEAHLGLALLLQQAGQLPEAAAHYAEAVRLQPDLAEAQNNLSNLAARMHDSPSAITHAQAAIRLKPDWAEAHYNLANGYFMEKKFQDAVAQYSLAINLRTNYLEAHQNLGYALEKLGRDKEAAEQYELVVKQRPGFAAAYQRLASVLARQGRYPEAVKAASEGIRLASAAGQAALADEIKVALQSYQHGRVTN